MPAIIFQESKSAMQSGKSRTNRWVLEFEQPTSSLTDPLMGWSGGSSMRSQVKLMFPSKEAALMFAKKHKISAKLRSTPKKSLKIQAYADNFV